MQHELKHDKLEHHTEFVYGLDLSPFEQFLAVNCSWDCEANPKRQKSKMNTLNSLTLKKTLFMMLTQYGSLTQMRVSSMLPLQRSTLSLQRWLKQTSFSTSASGFTEGLLKYQQMLKINLENRLFSNSSCTGSSCKSKKFQRKINCLIHLIKLQLSSLRILSEIWLPFII